MNSPIFTPLSLNKDPKSLGRLFYCDPDYYILSSFQTNRDHILGQVQQVLETNPLGSKIPVISNERLSGNPHSGGFDSKLIADRIQAVFPRTKILCVVREQKQAILSTYFQYLKVGGIDTLDSYLNRRYDGRRPGFSLAHFEYIHLIQYYKKLFQSDRVLVLPYEMFRKTPVLFLEKIGEFVGREIPDTFDAFTHIYNKGIYDNSLLAKFPLLNFLSYSTSLNAFSPFAFSKGRFFLDQVNRLFRVNHWSPSKLELEGEINAIVGDRYAHHNQDLSSMLGIDLSQYGYH